MHSFQPSVDVVKTRLCGIMPQILVLQACVSGHQMVWRSKALLLHLGVLRGHWWGDPAPEVLT